MEQCTKLFVYGTLQRVCNKEAFRLIDQHFLYLSQATVQGQLFDAGEYPAAIPAANHIITGEVYELKQLNHFSIAFNALDVYEAAIPAENEDLLYRREITEADYQNKKTQVWIYWYNQPIDQLTPIITGNYQQYLQQNSTAEWK